MSIDAGLEDCYRWASMTRAAQKMSCSVEGENVLLGTLTSIILNHTGGLRFGGRLLIFAHKIVVVENKEKT